MDVIILK